MTDEDRCLPWYYPPVDLDTRLCAPFEAEDFKHIIDLIPANECRVGMIWFSRCLKSQMDASFQYCLPNCEETSYSPSVTASKFHHCDSQDMGSNPLCDLPPSVTGDGLKGASVKAPMWGTSVIDDYRKAAILPLNSVVGSNLVNIFLQEFCKWGTNLHQWQCEG